mmetsp:Transcript_13266/g.20841  ORF Transcript_13266/g.20841 Transcript_13266/m.20841 type:complete len:109 (+) Transcript_13266:178-504(+)
MRLFVMELDQRRLNIDRERRKKEEMRMRAEQTRIEQIKRDEEAKRKHDIEKLARKQSFMQMEIIDDDVGSSPRRLSPPNTSAGQRTMRLPPLMYASFSRRMGFDTKPI